MADRPHETKASTTGLPAPEVLKPQAENVSPSPAESGVKKPVLKTKARSHHMTYRPSHKATFVGLSVVVVILAINAGIIAFVVRGQDKAGAEADQSGVTINSAVLDTLGVSRNAVGSNGTELVVSPNSRFNGTVTIGGDVSIAGQLRLNSKFSAADANLTKLAAGDTSLGQLNVNGDGTITSLNLRKDLNVAGNTRLQGTVTVSQLMTINNNLNVTGSLAVGGTLSARSFQASSLVSDTTLTIGGHMITRGSAPGVGPGPALGAYGSVSISGNDAAGTVAVNVGAAGAGGGIVANVAFRSTYGSTPHVVVTAVGPGASDVYVNRTASGFSIGVNGSLSTGGHAFDYVVMQ